MSKFDFSWKPDPNEPDMIHEFGTQWQKTGGPRYHVEGATEVKYEEQFKAKHYLRKITGLYLDNINEDAFDFRGIQMQQVQHTFIDSLLNGH